MITSSLGDIWSHRLHHNGPPPKARIIPKTNAPAIKSEHRRREPCLHFADVHNVAQKEKNQVRVPNKIIVEFLE